MNFTKLNVDKEEQIKKIYDDTEELIQSFRKITTIIIDNLEKQGSPMYNLGKKLVNYKEETSNEKTLGSGQINIF